MNRDLTDLREDYQSDALDEASAGDDPLALFARWFADAQAAGSPEPNAMTLATVDAAGHPVARMVLLKEVAGRHFRLYTNLESRKGVQLDATPRAALVFWWPPLERQVRVEGNVIRTPDDIADAYFQSRPHASRLGAWASQQSRPAANREELEQAMERALEAQGEATERPPFWGGYDVIAERIEFWQGRSGRMHDRLVYSAAPDGWARERLYP